MKVESLSLVHLFVTPWTVALQAPPSIGFSRQEYWSGLPFPSPGDLPNPGIEPRSPALQADALTSEPPGKLLRLKKKNLLQDLSLGKSYAVLCLVAQSCLTLCDPMECSLPGSSVYGDSLGKNTGVGYHALLQGIFPT